MLLREIFFMEKFYYFNIIRFYEVIEMFLKLYFVMEYVVGGELFVWILNEGKLYEWIVCWIYV